MEQVAMSGGVVWALFFGGALCGMAVGVVLGVAVLLYQVKLPVIPK